MKKINANCTNILQNKIKIILDYLTFKQFAIFWILELKICLGPAY